MANNTICGIVPDTCNAIVSVIAPTFLHLPSTPEEWLQVSKDYEQKWHLPHCIGSLDGKHIRIRNPNLAVSHFFNYKKYYSLVLLALVDANYRFLYLDVGAVGAESDGGVWARTRLSAMCDEQNLNLPEPELLPNAPPTSSPVGYYIVADDAFHLRTYLMKPFPCRGLTKPEKVYNYRLTRARRTVENAFGILKNRFRVLHTPICLHPKNVEAVVQAACTLHNMLRNVSLEGDHAPSCVTVSCRLSSSGEVKAGTGILAAAPHCLRHCPLLHSHYVHRSCPEVSPHTPPGAVWPLLQV